MKPVHGSVVVLTPRQSRVEDVDLLSVWCGACQRWHDVELPRTTADEWLCEHCETFHGLPMFPELQAG